MLKSRVDGFALERSTIPVFEQFTAYLYVSDIKIQNKKTNFKEEEEMSIWMLVSKCKSDLFELRVKLREKSRPSSIVIERTNGDKGLTVSHRV